MVAAALGVVRIFVAALHVARHSFDDVVLVPLDKVAEPAEELVLIAGVQVICKIADKLAKPPLLLGLQQLFDLGDPLVGIRFIQHRDCAADSKVINQRL